MHLTCDSILRGLHRGVVGFFFIFKRIYLDFLWFPPAFRVSLLPPGEWHFSHPGVLISPPISLEKKTRTKSNGEQCLGTLYTSFATGCESLLCMLGTLLGAGGEENLCTHDMATKIFRPALVFPSHWSGCDKPTLAFQPLPLDGVPRRSLSMQTSAQSLLLLTR